MRYQCDNCGIEFEEPNIILREADGQEHEVSVCPNCEGLRYREKVGYISQVEKTWACAKCGRVFPRHTKIPAPEGTMCDTCRHLWGIKEAVDLLVEKYLPFLEKLEKKYDELIHEYKRPEHECKGEHFGDGIARHMFTSSKGFIREDWTGWVIGIGAITVSIKHCPFCGYEL